MAAPAGVPHRWVPVRAPQHGLLCARLPPGAPLRASLCEAAAAGGGGGAWVVTCVGSLRSARLRLAGASAGGGGDDEEEHRFLDVVGPVEVCGLVGTFAADGRCHLHATLADERGRVVGGHLVGDDLVHTTCEVVLGVARGDAAFSREHDELTGYDELVVSPADGAPSGPQRWWWPFA